MNAAHRGKEYPPSVNLLDPVVVLARLFPLLGILAACILWRSLDVATALGTPVERAVSRSLVVAFAVFALIEGARAVAPHVGRLRARPRLLLAGASLAVAYAIAHAFFAGMLRLAPDAGAAAMERGVDAFGPVTVWPALQVSILGLTGHLALGRLQLVLVTAALAAAAVVVLVERRLGSRAACSWRQAIPGAGAFSAAPLFAHACPSCLPAAGLLLGVAAQPSWTLAVAPTSWAAVVLDATGPLLALAALLYVSGPSPQGMPPWPSRWRRLPPRLLTALLVLVLVAPVAQAITGMPHGASARQDAIYQLHILATVGATLLTLVVFGLLLGFGYRYRASNDEASRKHRLSRRARNVVHALYVGVPVVVVFGIGLVSYGILLEFEEPPAGTVYVNVVANQFVWRFQYPDGTTSLRELHVEAGQLVVLNLSSPDVIHSLFIPDMGVKMDAYPGVVTQTWFRPHKAGTYAAYCAEFCGVGHPDMRASVIVFPEGTRDKPYGEGGGSLRGG